MYALLNVMVVLLATSAVAVAAPPDAELVIKQMRVAMEPDRSSIRRITFRIGAYEEETTKVVLGQVRKQVGGKNMMLNVVLTPENPRGTAFLIENEPASDDDVQWIYVPFVRRVRKLMSPEAYESFLNSDFTYAELGFIHTGATRKLLAEEQHDGTKAYKIESIPKTQYYSRFVTWIAVDSFLPIERQYFDVGGTLWKVQRWDQVAVIDGVPTTLHMAIENVQTKSRTDVDVSAVRYDLDIPDGLLDPTQIPKALDTPIWAELKP